MMSEDRLERLVRAAVRGIMEAVLAVDTEPVLPLPQAIARAFGETGRVEPPPQETIEFPSVSRIEEEIFGETPPPTVNEQAFERDVLPGELSQAVMAASRAQKQDLDRALETIAKVREQRERDARPDVQPGPGEQEVAEWLRVPQT